MNTYTHEVFRVMEEGQPTIYYYNINTRQVFDLWGNLVNDDWTPPNPKHWNIRPIDIQLENE